LETEYKTTDDLFYFNNQKIPFSGIFLGINCVRKRLYQRNILRTGVAVMVQQAAPGNLLTCMYCMQIEAANGGS
jgi:hypothetical protein